ncbi:unnamed protein product [Lactuca saligna]|uniref:Uncharacterized protein n=1 Tax=Lactuca saligna TaxID=75948 RepID=A0AA36E6P1_LACSI|nr:unnamed protein product [Lactuca saligna]
MAKRTSKKKKKSKTRKLVIPTESSEAEAVIETTTSPKISSPEKTIVIPPDVSTTKSLHEEVRTSDIPTNVSNTDVNVTMGEGDLSKDTSQAQQESEEEGGFGGTFEELEFDDEEENFPDHMIMSMKQFKILIKKLNYIIQSQVDTVGNNSVLGMAIDGLLKAVEARLVSKMSGMLKDSECRIIEKLDHNDQNSELQVNSLDTKFFGTVKDLQAVAKERHTLFVLDVKKVREDVNFKLQELREEMTKEVTVVQKDYASLHQKFDIIANVVTKFVPLYEAMTPQLSNLSTQETKNLTELSSQLTELKGLIMKSRSSSFITPKFFSQKFTHFEAILQKQLAHLSKISTLLPMDAPPVFTGVQGGERKVGSAKAGGEALHEDAKVVGKVYSSKLSTTKPVITSAGPVTSTIVTFVPIPRPISKGIMIGSSTGGCGISNQKMLLIVLPSKAKEKRLWWKSLRKRRKQKQKPKWKNLESFKAA